VFGDLDTHDSLCRQIARMRPKLLVLLDHAEDNLFEIERELVTGARWWTVAELEKADAVVFPHQLPELVRRLTSSGVPDVPWELEWHQA
jgi:hypothetical protein